METQTKTRRSRGRVAGPKTERYQVLLEFETAEWAKEEPGGLSYLLRKLLRQSYEQAREKQPA